MIVCSYLALRYEDNKITIKLKVKNILKIVMVKMEYALLFAFNVLRSLSLRIAKLFGLIKN